MVLLPEKEWVLVASALIAHADQVFQEDEWHHLLLLLDEPIEADEADHWFALFLDQQGLQEHFAAMVAPPPLFAETILERAWRVALADGVGSEIEARAHTEIAQKLGVTADQAAAWRAQWTAAAAARAELVAAFAAILANLEAPAGPEQWERYRRALSRLPLAPGRQQALSALVMRPPTLDHLAARIMALSPDERHTVLLALVPLVLDESARPIERDTFVAMAERVALGRQEAQRMLAR